MELAKNLGAKGIFITGHEELGSDELSVKKEELKKIIQLETRSWKEIYEFLKLGRAYSSDQKERPMKPIFIFPLILTAREKATSTPESNFLITCLTRSPRHGQMDLEIAGKRRPGG